MPPIRAPYCQTRGLSMWASKSNTCQRSHSSAAKQPPSWPCMRLQCLRTRHAWSIYQIANMNGRIWYIRGPRWNLFFPRVSPFFVGQRHLHADMYVSSALSSAPSPSCMRSRDNSRTKEHGRHNAHRRARRAVLHRMTRVKGWTYQSCIDGTRGICRAFARISFNLLLKFFTFPLLIK